MGLFDRLKQRLVRTRETLSDGITGLFRQAGWGITWLACLPFFSLLEAAAVAYAVVRPATDFHVVKK